jgi:hypothetical protein
MIRSYTQIITRDGGGCIYGKTDESMVNFGANKEVDSSR